MLKFFILKRISYLNIIVKCLILITIFCSCASEDSVAETGVIIQSISPRKGKIGDSITILGKNLGKVSTINFKHNVTGFRDYDVQVSYLSFISRSDEKLVVKIPTLANEDISVSGFDFDLVGFIPILKDIDVIQSQALTDKVALVTDGKKIYKSTDGYFKWESIYTVPNAYRINCFYYLDENHCWIGISGTIASASVNSIYYSENGGLDFVPKVIGLSDAIRKIQFSSLIKGYFVDYESKMYFTNNDTFENIYSYYPNLYSLISNNTEINDFTVVNENLVFIAPARVPYLIKMNNQNISHSEFDISTAAPQFFNNIGYVQVNSDIYKTTDLGDNWLKIKTFPNHYSKIHFLDENVGFAMVNYTPYVYYKTVDGGNTWFDYWTPTPPSHYLSKSPIVPKKNIGLFASKMNYFEGKSKYIEE